MTAMPKTHEAWRLHAPDDLRLDEGETPKPGPHRGRHEAVKPPWGCQIGAATVMHNLDLTPMAP
jgi:hypothetical protein